MAMKKRAFFAVLLLGFLFVLAGCKTYEDSPLKKADDWVRKNIW